MRVQGFRAPLLSVPDDPAVAGPDAVRHEADALVVVEDGLGGARGPYQSLSPLSPGLSITHFPDKLIVPGFVDAHIHYPQTDRIAAHGAQLLDWLDQHIFPAEQAFADPQHAATTAAF